MTTGTKDVSTPSAEVALMREDWAMSTALLGGTRAMRDAGPTYLPKWPNESDLKYQRRKAVSTLFPAFKRTVVTLAARPFSKPITLNTDIPAPIKPLLDDVDLEGRNLDAFSNDLMQAELSHGYGGIFVDHKRSPRAAGAPPLTIAEERAAGLRPYMIFIRAEQILGWKHTVENGAYRLTQLRIMESVDEDDGEFGTKKVKQVRVLEPGKWRTFRETKEQRPSGGGPAAWVEYESGTTTLAEIPFVPLYGERLGFMCARSPLLELAHLNVKHWQSQSDQDNLMHVARVPILTAIGIDDTPDKPFSLTIGASGAVKVPLGGELKYTEHTGAAIGAGKQSQDDLKEEMRQSGAELLVIKPGPTTATEVASDNAVGMCDLQRLTLTLQDALNYALAFMGQWLNLPKGGTVKLFTDFGAATLAEASMQLVVSMGNSGILSKKTVIDEGKRRGILSAEVDYDEEQQLIDAEGPPVGKTDPLTGLPYDKPAPPQGAAVAKPTVQ